LNQNPDGRRSESNYQKAATTRGLSADHLLQNSPFLVSLPVLQQPCLLPLMIDLDSNPIPRQDGHAVLDLQGQVIQHNEKIPMEDVKILYQMLVASAPLAQQQQKRMTISFDNNHGNHSVQYQVARDAQHIYIVKTLQK
jgi:hypothetical protein